MANTSLTDIIKFLDCFRSLSRLSLVLRSEEFQQTFDRLKTELIDLKRQAEAEGRIAAPDFNVFRLLGLSRYETRTHSALLGHLLYPGETHGQRFLFLKSFLNYCVEKKPSFPKPSGDIEVGNWEIYTELITPTYGRLDIVLRSPDLNYLCVIENKVDALEQYEQISRYGRWLENQKRDYPDQALIYLTIRGDRAYTAQDTPYFRFSYHQDISNWLSQTLDQIQAPNVRNVVQQYINLVRFL